MQPAPSLDPLEPTQAPPATADARSLPEDWSGVDVAWLRSVLGDHPEFTPWTIVGLHLEPLGAGRGFAADLARIHLHEPERGAPRTLIAKLAASRGATRDLLVEFGGYDREARFYLELAPRIGIPVPRCYFAASCPDEGRFALLLEDLAPAEGGDQVVGATLEQSERVLRALANMHARWWNDPVLPTIAWLPSQVDMERVRSLYHEAVERFCGVVEPRFPLLGRAARELDAMIDALEPPLQARPPYTLVHGDFRLDNMFFPSPLGGRFGLVDWQTATIGLPSTDVGGWLVLSHTVEQRRTHGARLLAIYHAELRQAGVRGYPLFRLRLELWFLQLLYVMGSVVTFAQLELGEGRGLALVEALWERQDAALADSRFVRWLPWMRRVTRLRARLLAWLRAVVAWRRRRRSQEEPGESV